MAYKASTGKTADRYDPLIDGFLQAISATRAASPNTLAAYRRDLFLSYFQKKASSGVPKDALFIKYT